MMDYVLSVSVEMWLCHPLASVPQSEGSWLADFLVPWASAHLFYTSICINPSVSSLSELSVIAFTKKSVQS